NMTSKSILDITVSCFSNYKSTVPVDVNLLIWLKSIKHTKKVEEIRNSKDENLVKALKSKLPAITPSGTFSKRNTESLIQHTGLMQFDIDFKDNQHIENYFNLKNEISKIKEVAYCGISISGKGFWGLIPISEPSKHKEHFESLFFAFKNIGINIDKSCADVSRLRGYSIDTEAYFNHHAPKFTQTLNLVPQKNFTKTHLKTDNSESIKNKVEKLLNRIQDTRIDIANTYESWFSVGCCFANEFGEQGRTYFHLISNISPIYKEYDTNKQFDNCLKNKYSFNISTFFHFCKLNNVY
ncbi:PriCT-2 domain-containing protein, partial [Polaribacter sp. BAL334]|uniref:BT4734/BF3469 family protein n=1 Tax=Polaribacter sp. BAL334 TaxID=1708178 RepID=UPI0018D211A2